MSASVFECLVKQFVISLGVVVILLLNVMEVLSVGGGALLDRLCMVLYRVYLCMSGVISSFRSLRAGSQVFVGYSVFSCHQDDVCENYIGSVYVGGYCGLSKSGLCVFCKLCPVCFLVVGKGPSVLL